MFDIKGLVDNKNNINHLNTIRSTKSGTILLRYTDGSC